MLNLSGPGVLSHLGRRQRSGSPAVNVCTVRKQSHMYITALLVISSYKAVFFYLLIS